MELTLSVHQDVDGYFATVVELPGCIASGRTMTELMEALHESVGLYLDDDTIGLLHEPLAVGTTVARVVGTAG